MDDGGTVMVDGSGLALPKWYPEWESLEEQLRRPHVGFAALDMAEPHAGHTLAMLGSVVSEVLSVGQRFAEREEVADTAILLAHGTASTLVVDIEVLFTPETGVSVVPLLHQMAKQGPLIVAWPGYIGAGRFRYSQMGRSDYVDAPVDGALILHPVETHFPDECPFAIERNSA